MGLAAGMILGQHEIRSPLGAGGMGEVLSRPRHLSQTGCCYQGASGLVFARSRSSQPLSVGSRSCGRSEPPNILSIFHIGQQEGSPYIVSELLEGETLRSRLRESHALA